MRRPLLLDLFCGAGGAAMGYHRAGFDVIGVDIAPQPHYPFRFYQGDALTVMGRHLGMHWDAIHASPPCQGYSRMRHLPWLAGKEYPLLIEQTRALLEATGLPWAIENVEDAPMPSSTVLCGQTFGLPLYRHRRFGSSQLIVAPPHQRHHIGARGRISTWERNTRLPDAMGVPWMTQRECAQAIPPAYTEWVGAHLIAATASKADT